MASNLSATSQLTEITNVVNNDFFEVSQKNSTQYDSRKITYQNIKATLSLDYSLKDYLKTTTTAIYSGKLKFSTRPEITDTASSQLTDNSVLKQSEIDAKIETVTNSYFTLKFVTESNGTTLTSTYKIYGAQES